MRTRRDVMSARHGTMRPSRRYLCPSWRCVSVKAALYVRHGVVCAPRVFMYDRPARYEVMCARHGVMYSRHGVVCQS